MTSAYKSYSEYLVTPEFLQARAAVEERSQQRCENGPQHGQQRCGRKATDMHHVRYCRWGTFDPPENLLHVCRQCHAKLHTCPGCGTLYGADWIKQNKALCETCIAQRVNNGR